VVLLAGTDYTGNSPLGSHHGLSSSLLPIFAPLTSQKDWECGMVAKAGNHGTLKSIRGVYFLLCQNCMKMYDKGCALV
jgi:hypothetical protein